MQNNETFNYRHSIINLDVAIKNILSSMLSSSACGGIGRDTSDIRHIKRINWQLRAFISKSKLSHLRQANILWTVLISTQWQQMIDASNHPEKSWRWLAFQYEERLYLHQQDDDAASLMFLGITVDVFWWKVELDRLLPMWCSFHQG